MEKIQSAIEKARAVRNAEAAAAPPVSALAGIAAVPLIAVAADAKAAAWTALTVGTLDPGWMRKNRIVALTGGADAVPFDMMRTKVLQQMRANGWKRLAITSPTSACGKSTIALNLAFSLARQSELRTILCEMDLRRPVLKTILGLHDPKSVSPKSLARVLEGGTWAAGRRIAAQRRPGGTPPVDIASDGTVF